jgi:hypothetical protein
LLVLLILLIFFTYGPVYQLLKSMPGLGSRIGRHRYLLPSYFCIFGLGSWWLIWKSKISSSVGGYLNIMLGILVLVPISKCGSFYLSISRPFSQDSTLLPSKPQLRCMRIPRTNITSSWICTPARMPSWKTTNLIILVY